MANRLPPTFNSPPCALPFPSHFAVPVYIVTATPKLMLICVVNAPKFIFVNLNPTSPKSSQQTCFHCKYEVASAVPAY